MNADFGFGRACLGLFLRGRCVRQECFLFRKVCKFARAAEHTAWHDEDVALPWTRLGRGSRNSDGYFSSWSDQIGALVLRHAVPAISGARAFVAAGPNELWKR